MDGKLNAALLRQLEEDASALLGEHSPSHIGAIQILSIGIHISDPGPIGEHGVSMVAGSSLQTRFGIRFVELPRSLLKSSGDSLI